MTSTPDNNIASEVASLREVVARIDERTAGIVSDIAEIRRTMVTRPEFNAVKAIAYGLVGIVMTGVVAAILNQVLTKGAP